MSSSVRTKDGDFRDWAGQQLGVPVDAIPQQARHAFLECLDRSEFLPRESEYHALGIFDSSIDLPAKTRLKLEETLAQDRREQCQDKIEEFAVRFWKLPPNERQREWTKLRESSQGFPALLARLDILQVGLDVQIDLGKGKLHPRLQPIIPLVEALLSQFPLPPVARTAERRNWLASSNRDSLCKQAMQVRDHFPNLVALDPFLIEHLCRNNKSWEEEDTFLRPAQPRETLF